MKAAHLLSATLCALLICTPVFAKHKKKQQPKKATTPDAQQTSPDSAPSGNGALYYWAGVRYVAAAAPDAFPGATTPCQTAGNWISRNARRLVGNRPCGWGYLSLCSNGIVLTSSRPNGKNNTCPEGTPLAYDEITAMARGRTPSNLVSDLGLLTALGGEITAAATINKWAGIWSAIGIGGLAFLFHGALGKQNYIAFFFNPLAVGAARDQNSVKAAESKGNVSFPKGEIVIFQIKNTHDFWNESMILNAKTGLQFEDEAATAGGGPGNP